LFFRKIRETLQTLPPAGSNGLRAKLFANGGQTPRQEILVGAVEDGTRMNKKELNQFFKGMKPFLSSIILMLLIVGCNRDSDSRPYSLEFFAGISNIQSFNKIGQPDSIIILNKESSFGDTDSVFYNFIFRLSVDDSGKVYLNNERIHVYSPDGSYHESIGEKGRGPGEFQVIHNYLIKNNKLYVFDAFIYRISVFSVNDFSLINEISLETLEGMRSFGEFKVYQNGMILVGLKEMRKRASKTVVIPDEFMSYYIINNSGELSNEMKYETTIKGSFSINTEKMHASGDIPDDRTTLMEMGEDDKLYLLWTDDLAIKTYSSEGDELGGIYYPLENATIQDSTKKEFIQQGIGDYYPETHPAVEHFLIDDKERIWIATIPEDRETFEWLVLNNNGKLLATFTWPRHKMIHVVKKGLAYAIERDQESGVYTAYSYNIEWKDDTN
jgi:hypothetical protein